MKKLCFMTAVIFTMAMFTLTANAATQAAQADASTISPCPSYCGGFGGVFDFSTDGGVGFTSAYTTLNNPDGDAQAGAGLDGPSLLPVLGAEGFSGPDSMAVGQATGLQKFAYSGLGTSISLDILLAGEASAPDPADAFVRGSVVVMIGSSLPFFTTDFGTLVFEVVPGSAGLDLLGASEISLDVNAGPQSKTDSISFSLNSGDEILVWASLIAGGTRSGFGDAFDTLTMSFSDPSGITPAPLPPAVVLLAPALLWLRTFARRC